MRTKRLILFILKYFQYLLSDNVRSHFETTKYIKFLLESSCVSALEDTFRISEDFLLGLLKKAISEGYQVLLDKILDPRYRNFDDICHFFLFIEDSTVKCYFNYMLIQTMLGNFDKKKFICIIKKYFPLNVSENMIDKKYTFKDPPPPQHIWKEQEEIQFQMETNISNDTDKIVDEICTINFILRNKDVLRTSELVETFFSIFYAS